MIFFHLDLFYKKINFNNKLKDVTKHAQHVIFRNNLNLLVLGITSSTNCVTCAGDLYFENNACINTCSLGTFGQNNICECKFIKEKISLIINLFSLY